MRTKKYRKVNRALLCFLSSQKSFLVFDCFFSFTEKSEALLFSPTQFEVKASSAGIDKSIFGVITQQLSQQVALGSICGEMQSWEIHYNY